MGLGRALCRTSPVTCCLNTLGRLVKGDDACGGASRKYLYLACITLWMIYLLIPMGSLKVCLDTPMDLIFIAVLLLSAQDLYTKGVKGCLPDVYLAMDEAEHSTMHRFTLCFIVVCGSVALYMLGRGIPGDIISLESVTAMPFWTVVGTWGWVGFACFFLMFVITYPGRESQPLHSYSGSAVFELYGAIRAPIAPMLAVAIFFPWNPAISLGLSRGAMFAFDYAFFWLKVALVQLFVFPAIGRLYLRLESRVPENTRYLAPVLVALVGIAALYADFLLL